MSSFTHIQRCDQVTEADIESACASRDVFEQLLTRYGEVSVPQTGAASILLVLARLASSACDWVDGDLSIELVDADDNAEVRIMTDLGVGMREMLFGAVVLKAPLSELTAAMTDRPEVLGALKIHRRSWKRVTLGATESVRRSTRPPRISEGSLFIANLVRPRDDR